MSKVSVTKDKLDILANAIANKSGEPLTLTLDEMVSAVDGIQVGGGGGSVTQDQDGFIILPPDGSGGGGGGSGDFSTAEVTIVNTLEEQIAVILPVLEGNVLKDSTDIGAGETQVLKMPIPTGGGAYITPTFLLGTVSGDIAFEDGLLIIMGNGTFTVTGID